MELSASIIPWISPSAAFIAIEDCAIYSDTVSRAKRFASGMESQDWALSATNPVNKVDSLQLPPVLHWRVDGCSSRGTQFFVRPLFSSKTWTPLRIDVFIPDQAKQPALLRHGLRSGSAFYLQNSSVNQIGLTRYILKVLETWSSSFDFEEAFQWLPFGSRIVIENIAFSTRDARIRILPNFDLERQLCTRDELQQGWAFHQLLPPSMQLRDLKLVSQLHDTISLVQTLKEDGSKLYIFKSSTRQLDYVYHELRNLLELTPHPNIISKPSYIILSKTLRGQQEKFHGFLLEYHPTGNLASRLLTFARTKKVYLHDRLRWARQIASALLHIQNSAVRYYSELKPDNVLLNADDDVILIDFEQHANWETFSAPEIYHVDNLMKLLGANVLPDDKMKLYSETLTKRRKSASTHEHRGLFQAWEWLDAGRQEAAMVYAFGKLLWCIFEGCSHTLNTLREEYVEPVPYEFPSFCHTPPNMQTLIWKCTLGSPEWRKDDDVGIARIGDRFYPKNRLSSGNLHTVTAEESMAAAKHVSQRYIQEMEIYFEALDRWETGTASYGDLKMLGFPERPSLKDILHAIVKEESLLP